MNPERFNKLSGIVDRLKEFSARATKNSDSAIFKSMMDLHSGHISNVCDTIAPKIAEFEALDAMINFAETKGKTNGVLYRKILSAIDFDMIPVRYLTHFKPLPENTQDLITAISNADDIMIEYFLSERKKDIENIRGNIELAERTVLDIRPSVEKVLAITSAGYYIEELDTVFNLD